MKHPLPPLARVLRELRAEQGVDQLDLALAIGASDGSYLSRLENGRAVNPSATFLARYVDAFRILGHALGDDQRERLAAAVLVAERTATTPASVLSRGLDACASGSWTQSELAAVKLEQHRDLLCVLAVLAIDLEAAAAEILEVGDLTP
jgi:transcriptional regulator with XRE-family HTH domain